MFSREIILIFPWKDRSPLLHIIDPNYPSFYLKCNRKYQKTDNFDISPSSYLPSQIFGVNPKFRHTPLMCILSKLDYAKFGVSDLFFS